MHSITGLYNWAVKEGKISKAQAGFRKHYSTTVHILTLTSIIKRELNSRKRSKVYVAFIDYKKAFVTVDRDKLSSHVARREYSNKAKGKILDLMKTLRSLRSFDSSLFFKLSMLLYASEIWGTTNIHVIETAHLFA